MGEIILSFSPLILMTVFSIIVGILIIDDMRKPEHKHKNKPSAVKK